MSEPTELPDEQDPEQLRVRRLLRDVAATDDATPPPMPADLAALLDARLAEVADERDHRATEPDATPARQEPLAPVVPLRRRLAPLLVGAAAVVLVAGGATALVRGAGGSDGMADSAAGGSAASESQAEGGDADASTADDGSGDAADESESPRALAEAPPGSGEESGGETRMTQAPYLTVATFPADVRELLATDQVASSPDRTTARRVDDFGCLVPDGTEGALTYVSLDGDPAVLVVGPVRDGEQQVRALACGDGAVAAETQVPASD